MRSYLATFAAAIVLLLAASCSPPKPEPTPTPTPVPTPTPTPIPTPHPAVGANQAAMQMYPDLAKQGSTFNRVFWDYYNDRKKNNPTALQSPDWPLELARHVASALNVSPYSPTPVPSPKPMPVVKETPPPPVNWFEQHLREKPALDRPAYGQRGYAPYYVDAYGRRYWIDVNGNRHYPFPERMYYVDPYGQQYWIDQYGGWHYY